MQSLFKKGKCRAEVNELPSIMGSYSKTTRLVIGALLGSLTFIFQSAGVFAGIGYILSMMATGPIVLACLLSLKIGVLTYFVTIFLLAMFQPSELLVFPFTTGLLGLGLGMGLKYLKKSLFIISFAALCLTLGISVLLYLFKFPILGPSINSQFNILVIGGTFAFSLLYSWIWLIVSIAAIKLLNKILYKV